jgi:hypothetical protein
MGGLRPELHQHQLAFPDSAVNMPTERVTLLSEIKLKKLLAVIASGVYVLSASKEAHGG